MEFETAMEMLQKGMMNESKEEEMTDKTVMEEWAEEGERFKKAVMQLANSYGFRSDYQAKDIIKTMFPEDFLKMYNNWYKHNHYRYDNNWYKHNHYRYDDNHASSCNSVQLGKSLLFASTFLQTIDLAEIIKWANG